MSRAFVKETAESAAPPERMVSSGPNLVTQEGLAKITGEVERLETALAVETNVLLRETLERDLRYWRHSKGTAQVVARPSANGAVSFGSKVTLKRNGRTQTLRIVGEDEADPKAGLVNFRSPLAQALIGAEVGDTVEMTSPPAVLLILEVS
jgi:transcription elongation GreA/GreB family factor